MRRRLDDAVDGFIDYIPKTEETPVAWLAVASIIVALALFYVAFYVFCLPSWRNLKEQEERRQVAVNGGEAADNEVPSDGTGPFSSETDNRQSTVGSHRTLNTIDPRESASLLRPDAPPEPIRSREVLQDSAIQAPSTADRASAVPSTTSSARRRLQQHSLSDRPIRSWDLTGTSMRLWKHRGPLSRVQSMRRQVQNERHHQVSSEDGGSNASRSRSSWNSRTGSRLHSHRGVSDLASNVLEQGNVEGEAQFYRQRYMERNRRRRGPNSSASSVRSALPGLSPDAVSPDEAADAHDPGTLNVGYTDEYAGTTIDGDCFNCCSPVGNLLDYSDLDYETRRIMTLTFPATIEAVVDPLFRMGVAVLISNFLDTNSMVAFLLVSLLLRTSAEEAAGALVDAQSSLLQEAIAQGGNIGFSMAGRAMQLGIHIQFLFMAPILGFWAYFMEDVITWFIPEQPGMARVAADYTWIIVIEFYIKALSRSFMLVFHLTGQAQFELNTDLTMTAITITLISIAAGVFDGISLEGIAWIQVAVTVLSSAGKVAYLARKGLLKPYQEGLLGGFAFLDVQKVKTYLSLLFPLLVGSLVESGEWQILILFVQHLGGAEVAGWAMMSILWEICEAFTEGLGEGAAVRISYYLTENLPELAEQLANKAVFLSIMESTILTAICLMIGPNLSVALTDDAVLQNLFNDLIPMVALANMSMSLAQIYWSIVGAQGNFHRASAVILADRWLFMIPLAITLIYTSNFDLLSVAASLAVGYAIGSVILARMVFKSDWATVAAAHREDMGENEAHMAEIGEEEENESEDDSSTGFG